MTESRFTFELGGWYAMTMYPGYGDCPYRSPVEIHAIVPLGHRLFELSFFNVGYAAGVQQMEKQFRTLDRYPGALITKEEDVPTRTTIFEPLTAPWVSAFAPGFATMLLETLDGKRKLAFYRPS